MSRGLSWDPVRTGNGQYCSPACGGKCTWASYQAAKRKASALAKSLGAGWKPEVHENLGWYYRARFDDQDVTMKVTPVAAGFLAYVGTAEVQEAKGAWTFSALETDTDARRAVRRALQRSQGCLESLTRTLQQARRAVPAKKKSTRSK